MYKTECPVCGSSSWQHWSKGWVSCEGSMEDGSACKYGYNKITGEEDFD